MFQFIDQPAVPGICGLHHRHGDFDKRGSVYAFLFQQAGDIFFLRQAGTKLPDIPFALFDKSADFHQIFFWSIVSIL